MVRRAPVSAELASVQEVMDALAAEASSNGFVPVARATAPVIAERTGTDTDTALRLMEGLAQSGNWERVLGAEEFWFDRCAIAQEALTPSEADREALEHALARCAENSAHWTWASIEGAALRPEVIEVSLTSHAALIAQTVEASEVPVAASTAQAVHAALAAHYLPGLYFTRLSYALVAERAGVSVKSVRSAVRILGNAGLWATVHGAGAPITRFYPLFVEFGQMEADGLLQPLAA